LSSFKRKVAHYIRESFRQLHDNNISANRQDALSFLSPRKFYQHAPQEMESYFPSPDDFFPRDTNLLHNTPQNHILRILYPWHPDFGREVYIDRVQFKGGKLFCNYRLNQTKKHIAKETPAWMFEEKSCSGLKISDSPSFCEEALFSLREILDELISGIQGSENATQIPGYLKNEEEKNDSDRSVGRGNCASAVGRNPVGETQRNHNDSCGNI
jgi:hypothetical protein